MSTTTFPVDSFKEAATQLRRPFTSAAVKFKVQATWPKDKPTGGLIVGYIDARLAVERLNLIVPHLWHDEYEPAAQGFMLCRLTVDGITRQDVGEGVGKGLYSDALKRAAVKFGIGVSLYAIPKMIVDVSKGQAKERRTNKGLTLELTQVGEGHVRTGYVNWLKNHGSQAFGDPLDHGDTDGSQGDAEVDVPEAESPPSRQPDVKPREVADAKALDAIIKGMEGLGWKTGEVRLRLTAVGVQDVSDVRRALGSLSPRQADELWDVIEAATQEKAAA